MENISENLIQAINANDFEKVKLFIDEKVKDKTHCKSQKHNYNAKMSDCG